ncbi:MAG: polyphosphate polymerase domain-containing protein [Pirellulaceae bacterium]
MEFPNTKSLASIRHTGHEFASRSAGYSDASGYGLRIVEDQGEKRSDLRKRTESKFLIPGADIESIRQILKQRFEPQTHGHKFSTVRSLYFDDPRLSACRANLEGLDGRRKVRIRWYDSPKPQHEFFFEVKWRENKLTGKHRLRMNAERPLHQWTFRQLQQQLNTVLPEKFQSRFLRNIEPVLIVEYRREHFVAIESTRATDVRLTLDYDLKFYDQTGRSGLNLDFGRRMLDFALIECKVPSGFSVRTETLFSPLKLRIGSCSKYVAGCQTLDLMRA